MPVETAPISASFNLDFPVKLDDPEVFRFLAGPEKAWNAIPKKPGYTLDSKRSKLMGSIDHYPAPKNADPIRLYWAVEESYLIYRGPKPGQVVGSFNTTVPMSVLVKIEMHAVLFIKDGLPKELVEKLQHAFDGFDPAKYNDPVVYAQQVLASDSSLKSDFFWIANTYQIVKIGLPERPRSNFELTRDMFGGGMPGGCTVYVRPGEPRPCSGDGGYFSKTNTRFALVNSRPIPGLPNKHRDFHEVEIKPGDDVEDTIRKIADADLKNAGCDNLHAKDWPIITVPLLPETRWSWAEVRWSVCGKQIIFHWLRMETQESELQLWIYLRYPDSHKAVLDDFVECARYSALAGAVAGVYLQNFPVALAAFRAAFTACIVQKFSRMVDCLIPGLGLVTVVKTPWH